MEVLELELTLTMTLGVVPPGFGVTAGVVGLVVAVLVVTCDPRAVWILKKIKITLKIIKNKNKIKGLVKSGFLRAGWGKGAFIVS